MAFILVSFWGWKTSYAVNGKKGFGMGVLPLGITPTDK